MFARFLGPKKAVLLISQRRVLMTFPSRIDAEISKSRIRADSEDLMLPRFFRVEIRLLLMSQIRVLMTILCCTNTEHTESHLKKSSDNLKFARFLGRKKQLC